MSFDGRLPIMGIIPPHKPLIAWYSRIYEGFRLFLRCFSLWLLFVVTICLAVPAPALAHGEEAAAYPVGVLSSLPLVLLAVAISRPGWVWSAIIFLLAILSAFVAGIVPMDFLPSGLLTQRMEHSL
jgi:hypothetical protein